MRELDVASFGAALLGWYDRHARVLPWRTGPAARAAGTRPDPYRVWLSEVMLQQTTVAAVHGHFARFTTTWPDVTALALARDDEVMAAWAGLGYYARARNLLACARSVVADHGARFPASADQLRRLPGIGPYTAAAIAAIAFDEPAAVLDANVERVVARLFAVQTPLPAAKPALMALAAQLTPALRPGDHAQAMMDLGATVCTPRGPDCARCPVASLCAARAQGIAASLPRKSPKLQRPTRRALAYIARRADGALLLERRPPRGLLGGMLGWPTSDWTDTPADTPPLHADWRDLPGELRHTFTHFHLLVRVRIADVPQGATAQRGTFAAPDSFDPAALPSLMRKLWAHAQAAR